MAVITINLNKDDEKQIKDNIKNLSKQLGKRVNKSELIRFLLKKYTTKKDLFDIGYITYSELYDTPLATRIKKRKRKISKFY